MPKLQALGWRPPEVGPLLSMEAQAVYGGSQTDNEKRLIPKYPGKLRLEGTVGAGEADLWEIDEDIVFVPVEFSADNLRGLIVHSEGVSMLPYVHPGDLAVIRQTRAKQYGKIGAVRERDASTSILKVIAYVDGREELQSTNPKFEPITDGNYEYRGVLVGLMSGDGQLKIGPIDSGLSVEDIKRMLSRRL